MSPRIYNNKKLILVFLIFFQNGCSFSFSALEYNRGQSAANKGDFKSAVVHYKRVMSRDPESSEALEAAREAARISFFKTKKFAEAVQYYKHLVRYSKIENERHDAQAKIASIFFEKITDYPRAVEEYNKLLLLNNAKKEAIDYRFNLAKAYFYLNNFPDSQGEIESALKIVEDSDKKFDLLMFLGSIYFNTKRAERAINVYEDLGKTFPDRAQKENISMNIVVCYEELEAFDKAIEKLKAIRPTYSDKEFIDLRIKRLLERKANQPGSRGLRK
ncbi:MAG: hypothetical protein A2Z20_01135 [Bdellovibrionales bacterium RBG_16_40_8]|nr:MAG: hypothetical protein A2Z20_01135 [Bdellovibrionales bacterium RBG_16_40_8]